MYEKKKKKNYDGSKLSFFIFQKSEKHKMQPMPFFFWLFLGNEASSHSKSC